MSADFTFPFSYTQTAHLKERNALSAFKTASHSVLPILLCFAGGPCFSECNAGLTPIFEAQLSLAIPELVFCPSLESGAKGGLYDIVDGLVTSVFRVSSLVPRLSPQSDSPHYQVWDLQPSFPRPARPRDPL